MARLRKRVIRKILSGEYEGFYLDMFLRDSENIANFSCIPWVDFDSITTCIVESTQIQPLITWGKVNENHKMSISITVNHIFVNGKELGLFYKYAQEEFNHFLD